jgi:RimJ/RimL family protein N-acetyltransferase
LDLWGGESTDAASHPQKKGEYMIDAKNFNISDTLKDGTPVTIRAVRPDDKEKINEAFHNLEPETVYTRYFRYKNRLSEDELKWATEMDFENDVALVVTIQENNKEIVIGGSRYSVIASEPDTSRCGEIAFTVEEDYQGLGMASLLIRHMTDIARSSGVSAFVAEVLPQNKSMMIVFKHSGLPMKRTFEDGVFTLVLSLTDTEVESTD